jgi:hypothetical protein
MEKNQVKLDTCEPLACEACLASLCEACFPAMKHVEISVVPLQSSHHPCWPAWAGWPSWILPALCLTGAWPSAILRLRRSVRKTGCQHNIQRKQLSQYLLSEILVIVNSSN